MTRRQLVLLVLALVIVGVILGAGARQYDDAATRRTYLLTVVVLYTMALVLLILVVILVRLYPHVEGLVERHLKQDPTPVEVPAEVSILIDAVRTGRRSARGFETSLRGVMNSLSGDESEPVPRIRSIVPRLRKGPSIRALEAMLDTIEEK